jgi:hypothetical protein
VERTSTLRGPGVPPGGSSHAPSTSPGVPSSCCRVGEGAGQAGGGDDVAAGRREGANPDERAELVELRRKLRVAEMENDILRRAAAYFARENVLPK